MKLALLAQQQTTKKSSAMNSNALPQYVLTGRFMKWTVQVWADGKLKSSVSYKSKHSARDAIAYASRMDRIRKSEINLKLASDD